MVKAVQQVKGKVLKKSWYPVVSTKSFDSTYLGECYVAEPSMMLNRTLTVNLANLTGDIRQQGISLQFKISEVEDGKGIARVVGYDASPAQLRRLVRRGVERLDDSVVYETSDGNLIKVKPFAVTRTSISKSKLSLVRKILREEMNKEVRSNALDDLIKLVISNKFQTSLKSCVKKVLPLKALEIRKLQLIETHGAEKKSVNQSNQEPKTANKDSLENKNEAAEAEMNQTQEGQKEVQQSE